MPIDQWIRPLSARLRIQRAEGCLGPVDRGAASGTISHVLARTRRLAGLFCLLPGIANADVTLDGSLGPGGTLPGPHVTIPDSVGRTVGSNLFHSFGTFSIALGESATFTGPAGIANVLGRVTGGETSLVDGTLRSTIPNANLYLLNPAGVLFGANATLDLPGAFHVSTADYVRLQDGSRFNAIPGTDDVHLSTSPPAAFGFLDPNPAPLTLEGSNLTVTEGETLSIIGGATTIDSGERDFGFVIKVPVSSTLRAPGGRINIVAVASPGEITFSADGVDASGAAQSSELAIRAGSLVDASSTTAAGGTVVIRSGELTIDSAQIRADALTAPAGRIDIESSAADRIDIRNGSLVQATGTDGGTIAIRGGDIATDNSKIRADWFALGDGGSVELHAADSRSITLTGGSIVSALGNQGGQIDMTGGRVTISNTQVRADSSGTGPAGSISIVTPTSDGSISTAEGAFIEASGAAGGAITLRTGALEHDDSLIRSRTLGAMAGAGVTLEADSITFSNGAQLSVDTQSTGDAGTARILANGPVSLSGQNSFSLHSGIFLDSGLDFGGIPFGQSGTAGDLELRATSLSLKDQAKISSDTYSLGPGGTLDIRVDGAIAMTGESTVSVTTRGAGHAGALHMAGATLTLSEGAHIDATTLAAGDGGQVALEFSDAVELIGTTDGATPASRIKLDSGSAGMDGLSAFGLGDAGRLDLQVGRLSLRDGATISADTYGKGQGGDITVRTTGAVELSGQSRLGGASLLQSVSHDLYSHAVEAGLIPALPFPYVAGNSGRIRVTAGSLRLAGGGQINAGTRGTGNANDIDIQLAGDAVVVGTSTAASIAEAFLSGVFTLSEADGNSFVTGDAGSIRISAKALDVVDGAGIFSLSLGSGRAGDIAIDLSGDLRLAGENFAGTGSRINSQSRGTSSGPSGSIDIHADSMYVSDGGQISSSTFGLGQGGRVAVTVARDSRLSGTDSAGFTSGLFSATLGPGDGGEVVISSDRLTVTDGAAIAASSDAQGRGGDVSVTARQVEISRGGRILTRSIGTGDGGDISATVADSLRIDEGAIETSTLLSDGGNIALQVGRVLSLFDSSITTSVADGLGDGGNINIDPIFVVLNSSRIRANARAGSGGNIHIVADHFITSTDSLVQASSEFGLDGEIVIDSPDQDISGEVTEIDARFVDVARILSAPCTERSGANVIRLVNERYEVLPDSHFALRGYLPERQEAAAMAELERTKTSLAYVSSDWGCNKN